MPEAQLVHGGPFGVVPTPAVHSPPSTLPFWSFAAQPAVSLDTSTDEDQRC